MTDKCYTGESSEIKECPGDSNVCFETAFDVTLNPGNSKHLLILLILLHHTTTITQTTRVRISTSLKMI